MEAGELEMYVVISGDGSNTIKVPALKEHYHSHKGAINESKHVFIKMGLEGVTVKDELNILEVGFGTGLNAWLALVWAEQNQVPVLYHSIEPFPVSEEIYSQLNYTEHDHGIWHYHKYFQALHELPWNEGGPVSEYFNFKKDQTSLTDAVLYPVDVVFFDAFAPSKQPELWKKEALTPVVDAMRPGAVFTTYCAMGQLKRDLKDFGLEVETLPGPPGKKEMTRAWKAI